MIKTILRTSDGLSCVFSALNLKTVLDFIKFLQYSIEVLFKSLKQRKDGKQTKFFQITLLANLK